VTPTTVLDGAARLLDAAAAGEEVDPIGVELRDGTWALVRPIRATDKDRLRHGLEWLSPRSRELAFHVPLQELTAEQLRYVTEIDHRDHVAWVALDPDDLDAPGMGIGRYVRLRHDPVVAEAAITVLDRYQGRGLGTLLLALLTRGALANGIRVFRNYVLTDNDAMLELFDQLGASRQLMTRRVYEVDFALPDDVADLPDTPAGRAIRTFARAEDGPQLALTLPPVWSERLRLRGEDAGSVATRPAPAPLLPEGWRERGPFGDWLDRALGPEVGATGTAAQPHAPEVDGADGPPDGPVEAQDVEDTDG
jgi:GNAT superfamily N-acetyltransferase